MTTRCSFRPRLRTSDRVPALGARAGTMTLVSAAAATVSGLASVFGCGFAAAALAGGFAGSGTGVGLGTGADALAAVVRGAGAAGVGAAVPAEIGGAAAASLPTTSMITRSGSRSVKLVTRLI